MLHYSQNYIDDILVRFAYHSNAIEGNSLTRGQTKAIILNQTVTVTGLEGVKLRDVYEAANQKDAFYTMLALASNNAKLSIDTILQLQFELTKNTIATAGKFKTNENYIVGSDFQTSSVAMTPMDIKQWAENTTYCLEQSKDDHQFLENLMQAHIAFERIHPFDDGNGRTGRELINLELAKREMPFLIIEKKDRDQYLTLEADQDAKGLTLYATEKLEQERKRYEAFEQNYKKQKLFEKKSQKRNRDL